jgi:hypothetical protein
MQGASTTAFEIPDHERRAVRSESYPALVARLSRASVTKHFDAYEDVDWDAPEHRIDAGDPRFERTADDPLGATAWYQALPQPVRARLGLHLVACQIALGLHFENTLKIGLLQFATEIGHEAPEFRYAYHEVIEEAQHSLMFRELVQRMALPVPPLPWIDRIGSRRVARFGRTFPELFFLFVLGGEEPIDFAQRQTLLDGHDVHPLLRRVMQIHVTEEARHIRFAREYLRRRVPALPARKRVSLAVQAPLLLADLSRRMLRPPAYVVRAYAMPREVVAEAYTRNPRHRALVLDSLASVRALCRELGLVTRWTQPLWRGLAVDA